MRFDDGDVEAALPGRRGDLGADPAGADDDDRAAAVEPLAQRVGVLDAAQVEHAVERFARDREAARLGAGAEQQPVVAQPLAVVERQPGRSTCPGSLPCGRAAARSRARRRTPRRGRRPSRARTRRAGSPSTAAVVRRGARARHRSGPGGRRTLRSAASRRLWRRPGWRRRSRMSADRSCVGLGVSASRSWRARGDDRKCRGHVGLSVVGARSLTSFSGRVSTAWRFAGASRGRPGSCARRRRSASRAAGHPDSRVRDRAGVIPIRIGSGSVLFRSEEQGSVDGRYRGEALDVSRRGR